MMLFVVVYYVMVDVFRDHMRRVMQLPPYVQIEYKKHVDSLADKSSFRNPTLVWKPKENPHHHNKEGHSYNRDVREIHHHKDGRESGQHFNKDNHNAKGFHHLAKHYVLRRTCCV